MCSDNTISLLRLLKQSFHEVAVVTRQFAMYCFFQTMRSLAISKSTQKDHIIPFPVEGIVRISYFIQVYVSTGYYDSYQSLVVSAYPVVNQFAHFPLTTALSSPPTL